MTEGSVAMTEPRTNATIRERLGLRPVVNVSGTMTSLGASIIVPEAIRAMAEIGPQWVEMDDLQRRASDVIARLTGAEAGFVTACCASAMSLAAAGTMTGPDLLAIERLPNDTADLRNEIIVQMGHLVSFGAPVDQMIRVSGAKVVPAGTATAVQDYHVADAITERTAAALYVVSHHTVQYGLVGLEQFCEICAERNVPVIVDAASEYDLRGFLAAGADLVCYSGHKFLGGPTSGILAGRKELVRSAYLQNRGIGRGMKVGKETIAGAMAALEAWETRDHAGIRARERAALDLWVETLSGWPGIHPVVEPDPTHNPLDRLTLHVAPESGFTATGLAAALAAGDPPVIVRAHEAELGYFQLDPCNLHPGEAEVVAARLAATLKSPEAFAGAMAAPRRNTAPLLRWPD